MQSIYLVHILIHVHIYIYVYHNGQRRFAPHFWVCQNNQLYYGEKKKKNTRLVRFRNNRRVNPADDGGPSFKINYSSRNYAAATPDDGVPFSYRSSFNSFFFLLLLYLFSFYFVFFPGSARCKNNIIIIANFLRMRIIFMTRTYII